MPTKFSGRILLILVVLGFSLWAIFPSLNPRKPDLKPGIDMVGGTSLLYQIEAPPGMPMSDNLAEEVASALKKRVDPEGVRNLIWRPQGHNQLEIQMPMVGDAKKAAELRQHYSDAQAALEATNIRPSRVAAVIENPELSPEEKQDQLSTLAMGSQARQELFDRMLSLHQQIQQAAEQQNREQQARLELEYEAAKNEITRTNLPAAELESILSLPAETRDARLAELKEQFAGFESRIEAIERFQATYDDYAKVRNSLSDAADVKRLLRGSGVLEFFIQAVPGGGESGNITIEQYQQRVQDLQERGPRLEAGDDTRWLQVAEGRDDEFGDLVHMYNGRPYVLVWITPAKSMSNAAGGERTWALQSAYRVRSDNGAQVVGFTFDPAGAARFGRLTTENVGELLAISLDSKIINSPRIREAITQGTGTIDGGPDGYSEAELSYMVRTLGAGSLPAQLTDEPIMERTVGPQLGEDNLKAGLYACYFGVAVVAVFLIGYYYLAGVIAMIALLMNLVIVLGAMAALNATFTLPAVAGIVLTIGMSVDANVLIFERLREEQQRGLGIRMALRNAYERALSAIVDGNVTTALTAAALYAFGSEEVRGFGLTLLIGIVSSLFTALYVTRTIFGLMVEKWGINQLGSLPLTFPRWDRMLHPNVDWMSKIWLCVTCSAVFIVGGLIALGVQWNRGQLLDVEFSSGTAVQFELVEPMPIEEVRQLINAQAARTPEALPGNPMVVSVGSGDINYEVVTPVSDAGPVKDAVIAALGEHLKLERPSHFAGEGQSFAEVMNQRVVPITSADQQIAGMVPRDLADHVGGAAIVLEGLNPPLKPSEIAARIERQRLQPQPDGSTTPFRPIAVTGESGADQPTETAVILVSDASFPYATDPAKWESELAMPMWQLINEAVANPPELQKVMNFDAQVAAATQKEAVIALVLGLFGVMAYVWIRFGNLKFGTAGIIALVHDTLFVLAAMGYSYLLANTFIGRALLLDEFRINLTVVAAILTLVGYSINDTVIIYDRIRENRGKFGVISRQVINDSVNQTISRTLLTSSTTLVTLLLMYIIGGPGIHGFTFILVVGILTGTYSSIAIAAPILLIGRRQPQGHESQKTSAGQLQRA